MNCTCILKTGQHAGQPCGARAKEGKYCGRHQACGQVVKRARKPTIRSPPPDPRKIPRVGVVDILLPAPLPNPPQPLRALIQQQINMGKLEKQFMKNKATRDYARFVTGYFEHQKKPLSKQQREFIELIVYKYRHSYKVSIKQILTLVGNKYGADHVRQNKSIFFYYVLASYGKMARALNSDDCRQCIVEEE